MATEKGYLTSSSDLARILRGSNQGRTAYSTIITDFTNDVDSAATWANGSIAASETMYVNGSTATRGSLSPGYAQDTFVYYVNGGAEIYQKAMAYHLLSDTDYADTVIAKIDELVLLTDLGTPLTTSARYNGGNQWVLHCATSLPLWIQAADLIAGYSGWTTAKYQAFQTWLATEVYKYVSWASHVRKNNWGSAASLLCWMIADYVDPTYITSLTETVLSGGSAVGSQYTQTPALAKLTHIDNQINKRMATDVAMDSVELEYGINPVTGGIADELRRGSVTVYNDDHIIVTADVPDANALSYTCKHIEHLIFHAECLRRRGDNSIYEYTEGSQPSLKLAIRFVIDNPTNVANSIEWQATSKGVLNVAYTYYRMAEMLAEAQTLATFKGGGELPFGGVTHVIDTYNKRQSRAFVNTTRKSLIEQVTR